MRYFAVPGEHILADEVARLTRPATRAHAMPAGPEPDATLRRLRAPG